MRWVPHANLWVVVTAFIRMTEFQCARLPADMLCPWNEHVHK
jgi:hypothetical protein